MMRLILFVHQPIGFICLYFFNEQGIQTEEHKKYSTSYRNCLLVYQEGMKKLCKEVGNQYQYNIAGRNTRNQEVACFFPMIDAVLDDGENDRSHRNGQKKSQAASLLKRHQS